MSSPYGGHVARVARRIVGAMLPAVCPFCGRIVTAADAWDVDHATPLAQGGPVTTGLRPAHASCNRRAGQALSVSRRRGMRRWA